MTVSAAGKTVLKGGRLDADARNRDVAAIVLYALGVRRPCGMTSRVPAGLFRDVIGEPRPIHNDFNAAFRSAYYWFKTLYSALQGE